MVKEERTGYRGELSTLRDRVDKGIPPSFVCAGDRTIAAPCRHTAGNPSAETGQRETRQTLGALCGNPESHE
jgi:hypothetical protein